MPVECLLVVGVWVPKSLRKASEEGASDRAASFGEGRNRCQEILGIRIGEHHCNDAWRAYPDARCAKPLP